VSPGLSLLHYIVAHIAAEQPMALRVDDEREVLRKACKNGNFSAGEGVARNSRPST
jgi:hypothetical protein